MGSRAIRAWLGATAALAVLAFVPTSALAVSDLSIAKSDNADPVAVGAELVYTVQVSNGGPDAAAAVTITDNLPNELDFVSASASQGTCSAKNRRVTCELGALANGAKATATIRTKPTKAGQIENTATVSSTDPDPNKPNDSDAEVTTVTAPPVPTCAGKEATIIGTAGPDDLVGGPGVDVIAALGGNDTVNGLGGNDIICTAGGKDSIRGTAGDDTVRAGAGNDRARGGGGNDHLRGGGGNDRLAGGAGDDALFGGGGDDVCRGGSGSNTKRGC